MTLRQNHVPYQFFTVCDSLQDKNFNGLQLDKYLILTVESGSQDTEIVAFEGETE